LLVLVANPKTANTAIKDGEYVAVTGVLRSFVVADIERDYDLTWDLNLKDSWKWITGTSPCS